jgi:hypothetical protein
MRNVAAAPAVLGLFVLAACGTSPPFHMPLRMAVASASRPTCQLHVSSRIVCTACTDTRQPVKQSTQSSISRQKASRPGRVKPRSSTMSNRSERAQ